MRKVIVFGAGNNGCILFDILEPWIRVELFLDNDKKKRGGKCRGRRVLHPSELKSYDECLYDIILSVVDEKIKTQLSELGLKYYEIRDYFSRPNIIELRDNYLFERFKTNKRDVNAIFKQTVGNYYREDYYDEENKTLVDCLIEHAVIKEGFFDVVDAMNFDEDVFSQRPVLRLIARIIKSQKRIHNICDLGCGDGALIRELHKYGYSVTGSDASEEIQKFLISNDISIRCELVENCSFSEAEFDAVICTEVLEHVFDLEIAMMNIKKICAREGVVFISVPYGNECGHSSHVRQFTENGLANLLLQNGFDIVNIQRVPCSNDDYMSHILCEGIKR